MKSKPRRFVVCSDNHGDQADPVATEALFNFIDDYQPDYRIHAGDCFDFRNLRRGASDEEKAASLQDDWDCGTRFLERFFKGGTTRVFLRGNHDERLYDFRESATGLLRDYAADGIKRLEALMKRLNVKMLPYDAETGVYELGKLTVLHGYHCGVGATRQHANIFGNCIFGHVHTIESAPVASREPAEARSIGCLCRRDMHYINRKTAKLRWAQGWAYGVLFDDGTYQLFQTRNIGGRFYAATKIKSY